VTVRVVTFENYVFYAFFIDFTFYYPHNKSNNK